MSKSAHALVFCRLFSYTISLVSLAETLLSFSVSMMVHHIYEFNYLNVILKHSEILLHFCAIRVGTTKLYFKIVSRLDFLKLKMICIKTWAQGLR